MQSLTNPWVILSIYLPAIFAFLLGWRFLNKATELCKKGLKDIDFDKEDEREYKVVSEETAKEIDEALGLVMVSTKITKELYNKTILSVVQENKFVPQAALRVIIEHYAEHSWVQVSKTEDPHYPEYELLVNGYSEDTGKYFQVAFTPNQGFLWVDLKNNYQTLPAGIVISHWQHIDFINQK